MSKVVLLSVCIVVTGLQSWANFATADIKGYQEWKNEKVQLAQSQAVLVRTQLTKAQVEGNKKLADALEKQYVQLSWNLDVANDLNPTDYCVLYLCQLKNPDRFQKAAQKLSTKEVAELFEAYANSLGISPSEALVQPAPQVAIPAKLPVQAIQSK